MYNGASSQPDDSDFEWIEVFSNDTSFTNLTNWQINGSDFGDLNISPNRYIVIARQLIDDGDSDKDSFESFYGNNDSVWNASDGNYTAVDGSFSLTNGKGTISLANGTVTILFTYNGSFGDGDGKSVERINFISNIQGVGPINGTPGQQNSIFDELSPNASLVATTASAAEDTNVTISASASTDNQNITQYQFNLGDGGSITQKNSTLSHHYGLNGTYLLTLTTKDAAGLSSSVSRNLTITFVNDLANVTQFNLTFAEDGFNDAINLTQQVKDEETAAKNITWVASNTKNLSVTITSKNILNVSATSNFNGYTNFTLTATDKNNGIVNTTIFVNVTPVNDAPIIANITNSSITQESLVSFTVSASDVDNASLIFTKNVNFGTLNASSGLFTFTPNATFYRDQLITFTASDGTLSSSTNTTITVFSTLNLSNIALAHNPTFSSISEGQIIPNVSPFANINISVTISNAGTIRIDDLNTTLSSTDLGVTTTLTDSLLNAGSSKTKEITLQLPAVINEGIYDFTVSLEGEDDSLAKNHRSSNFSFSINVTKSLHQVIIQNLSLDNNSIKCASPVTLSMNVTNVGKDTSEEVFVSIVQKSLKLNTTTSFLPLTVNAGSTITQAINTANIAPATYTIDTTVLFNKNQSSVTESKLLTIENCDPVSSTFSNVTITEGGFNDALNLTNLFTDFNNDSLFFAFEGGKNIAVSITNGRVNITSLTDFNGNSTINFTANDASNLTKSNQIQVSITGVNDAPVITNIANQTVAQANNFTLQIGTEDIENDTLAFTIAANDTISIIINQSGFIHSFVPTNDQVGKVFLVNVSVNDGSNITTDEFTISVTNVNDGPIFNLSNPIANIAITEDSNTTLNLSNHFSDPDKDSLTFTSSTPINVSVSINGAIATFVPNANFSGVTNISFQSSDASSTSNRSNNIIINVTQVNDKPFFTEFTDSITAVIGISKTVTVIAKDIEANTLGYFDNTSLFNISSTGTITFTPTTNDNGSRDVKITAGDGTLNVSKTMTIQVVDALSLSNIRASINNGGDLTLTESSTLSNLSPGKKLKFTVNLTNNLLTTDVQLTRINVSLSNGSQVALSKVVSIGTVNKNTAQDIAIDFESLPFIQNGNYSLIIKVTAKKDTTDIATTFTAKALIFGEANQILLTATSATPSTLTCIRNSTILANVKNADGFKESLNASVTIVNAALGVNAVSSSQKINFSDEKTFNIPISVPLSVAAGSYNLTATATSTANTEATKDATILIQDCALSVSPVEDPTISSRASQVFTLTSFSDFPQTTISWFLDGINQTAAVNQASYTYLPDNKTGRNAHSVVAEVRDVNNNLIQHSWTLTTASFPIADTFTTVPDLSQLNETELHSVNLTISKSGTGKIVFSEPVNLSNVVSLDTIINFTKGIVAVDVSGINTVLNKAAQITLEGLTYTAAPRILFSSGFTTNPASFTQDCTNTFCKIVNATTAPTTEGKVVFNVSHFSSYLVNATSITAPAGNIAPSVNAGSDQSVETTQSVTLSGSANDVDGTIASLLWTQTSGTSVSLSSANSSSITFTAPSSSSTLTFRLTAIDNEGAAGSDTVNVIVGEQSRLFIKDLDVRVDDDTDKNLNDGEKISKGAKPGDTIKFDIEVENLFTNSEDIDIEDVEIVITIKDIDDGDDLEETVDLSDLEAGDDDSATITFEIPAIVDEDTYDIEIIATGESDNGTQRDIITLKLDVDKNRNELLIDRARLSPSFLSCDRSSVLSIRVVNTGSNEQDDVEILIESPELELERRFFGISLEEGNDQDDTAESEALTITVPTQQAPGIYPVTIKAFYDSSRIADQETVNLEVADCQQRTITPVLGDSIPTDIVTIPSSTPSTQTPTTISFRDSSIYNTLLLSSFIILLGAVIFAFGAAIILAKRK